MEKNGGAGDGSAGSTLLAVGLLEAAEQFVAARGG